MPEPKSEAPGELPAAMFAKIQKYWEDRAQASGGARQATTDDIHLRDLELAAIVATLSGELPTGAGTAGQAPRILDVGCGDGDTTLRIAEAMPGAIVHGIDYAQNMIAIAQDRLARSEAPGLRDRVSFAVGDATRLAELTGATRYAGVITCRALINLPETAMQYDVLRQIAAVLGPGGVYVGTENFMDGQRNLTLARAAMGLPEIAVRWHNLFFEREPLLAALAGPFSSARVDDFASSYYFATRVVYSAMCQMQGVAPDYDHEIHRLAPRLPPTGRFSPVQLIVAKR